MILFTDMAKHFDILGNFKVKFLSAAKSTSNFDDRLETLKMAMKCADIGHTAKEFSMHQTWSKKLAEEFFNQGDRERELG